MSLSILKKLVLQSGQLTKVWNYFFDLMDEGVLLKDSQPIPNPMEKDVLVNIFNAMQAGITQQLHKQVTLIPLAFSETRKDFFYHGSFSIPGIPIPGAVFYFSDIETGSFCYSKNGNNEMFRFSLTKITDPKTLIKH
jgi:hypothetical protein